ncbi:MAG: hypothetical protein R3C26_07755 [Calditrichia bacterium]
MGAFTPNGLPIMGYFGIHLPEKLSPKTIGIMKSSILATLITIIMALSIGQIGANQQNAEYFIHHERRSRGKCDQRVW